jgi:hypothetical protein
MTRSAVLWTLLCLFALRILGQLLVALELARGLPPMDEWQSGLLPYPALLASQVLILVIFGAICVQFSRNRGWFVRPNRGLGVALWVFGWIYACGMVVRYIVTMMLRPEMRWTGDLIPMVFHVVLASFLLTIAEYHQRACRAEALPHGTELDDRP